MTARRRKKRDLAAIYSQTVSLPYRESMGDGNFRYVPERYHDQHDTWYAELYQQRPETVGRSGQPKRRPRQRRQDKVMWYER